MRDRLMETGKFNAFACGWKEGMPNKPHIFNGWGKKIIQKTTYPENAKISITTQGIKTLALRIPSWCTSFQMDAQYVIKDGYAYVQSPGCITVEFDMPVLCMQVSEHVTKNSGRVALQRGPVIYCAEGIDNGKDLKNIFVDVNGDFRVAYDMVLGAHIIEATAFRLRNKTKELYRVYTADFEEIKLRLIPYYAFANREETQMLVWLRARLS